MKNNKAFKESDLLTFLTQEALQYGERITILAEPQNQNGQWITQALASRSQLKIIYSDKRQARVGEFIVLRSWRSNGHFSNRAVPQELLDESSEQIESRIIGLLRMVKT